MKKLIVSKEHPEGKLVDYTAEDIAAREKDLAHIEELKTARATQKSNKILGKSKLKSGDPLTDVEIDALFG